jgi:hypothetical protein
VSLDLVAVPVQPDVLASALDRHDDYRVLRRIRTIERPPPLGGRVEGIVGLALDLETTGLDHRQHEIIELAMQRFRMDANGRIVETGRPRAWFEQPSISIPAHITEITGLADTDVAGKSISDGEAGAMMLSADFVVAHNARFDRAFAEAPADGGRSALGLLAQRSRLAEHGLRRPYFVRPPGPNGVVFRRASGPDRRYGPSPPSRSSS